MINISKIIDCGDYFAIVAGKGKNPTIYIVLEPMCYFDHKLDTYRIPVNVDEIDEWLLKVNLKLLQKIIKEVV